MARNKVVCLGEVLFDVFADSRKLGGAPCNVAVMGRQLNLETFVVSAVGDDVDGQEIKELLQNRRVDCSQIQTNSNETGKAEVNLDEAGKATYTFTENPAWAQIEWKNDLRLLAEQTQVAVFGTMGLQGKSQNTILKFLESMHPKALKVLDINLREPFFDKDKVLKLLGLCNVLKLNDEEVEILAGFCKVEPDDLNEYLWANTSIRLIALSLGSKGAVLITPENSHFAEAAPVREIVDTVGAGDSYTAALVAGLVNGMSLNNINVTANRIAAYVCESQGATPELPPELTKFEVN